MQTETKTLLISDVLLLLSAQNSQAPRTWYFLKTWCKSSHPSTKGQRSKMKWMTILNKAQSMVFSQIVSE
jgi:hypothetical protein